MADVIKISSLDDDRVSEYCKLTETQLKNRLSPEDGLFIAESPKVIALALEGGYEPKSFLMPEKHIFGQARGILEKCAKDVPVYTADEEILTSLTGYKLTRGVLCAFKRKEEKDVSSVVFRAKRVAVLENIADATNVGAIVRSAAALGVDAVLFSPSCCDPLNRRAVRVSMGTIFQIPWARIPLSPEEWENGGVSYLHSLGFSVCALALEENSVSLSDERLKREERLALILGSEGYGLLPSTIKNSDYTVKIPMYHGVDSLNVAAASAVAFWEVRK